MSEESKSRNKARRSRAEIESILADYRRSGLTQVAFARERGLNLGTFRHWVARLRDNPAKGFCPVTIRTEGPEGLTIRLPKGIKVAVGGRVDPEWVSELVKCLQR